jgi:MFS family permease
VYVVFPLYAETDLSADRRTIGMWFAMIALATAAVQGGLIGRLVPRFGEVNVARIGAVILATGFLLLHPAAMRGSASFGAVLVLIGAGYGMGGPAMLGLISRLSGANHQGSTLGLTQSTSAMARIIGPPLAGLVMQHGGAPRAFMTASVIAVMAFGASLTMPSYPSVER